MTYWQAIFFGFCVWAAAVLVGLFLINLIYVIYIAVREKRRKRNATRQAIQVLRRQAEARRRKSIIEVMEGNK